MISEPTTVVMCNPADVNLADIKAKAADYNATVVGNPFCPRGKVFLIDPAAAGLPRA